MMAKMNLPFLFVLLASFLLSGEGILGSSLPHPAHIVPSSPSPPSPSSPSSLSISPPRPPNDINNVDNNNNNNVKWDPFVPKIQSTTISYQVHSYNDLREWPQILRKGTSYFKIDPHYMDASFCTSQPQTPQPTNPMGCFVLSHDTPVTTREYNSTYSVLNFISDPQYSMFYQNPGRRIYISLCYKLDNASPCDGSATAQNWTAVLDEFFATANAVVSSKGLNVEFILDGSATPTDNNLCLADKWRPWVTTWIPGQSAAAPYSNNATLGLDRFQVFNPPQTPAIPGYYIDIWELQNYGKFSKGNYSYLIWEPSDQHPILDIADSYLHGPLHQLGFRFAINIDPVQLQVFSGSRSGNAWNSNIVPSSTATLPSIVVLPSSSASSSFYVISSYFDTKKNATYFVTSTAPYWNSTQLGPVVTSQTAAVLPNTTAGVPVLTLSPLGPNIFASFPNGSFIVYNFSESSQQLTLEMQGQLSPCIACDATAIYLGDEAYAVQVVSGNATCALQIEIWNITTSSTAPVGLPFCLMTPPSGNGTSSFAITSYSISVSVSQADTFCDAGDLPGVIVFSDNLQNIYTSILCINPAAGTILANGGNTTQGAAVIVDVGSDTSVSLYQYNGQLMVLEVHANGFCWNSEPNNKQPTPATCSNTPISIPYVLIYNFGSFDDWALHVMNVLSNKNTTYNLDSFFSSCHPDILHGAYDSGTYPQVQLFSASDPSQPTQEVLLLAEVHIGLPSKYSNASDCGFAVPMDGVVLDAWRIDDWYF